MTAYLIIGIVLSLAGWTTLYLTLGYLAVVIPLSVGALGMLAIAWWMHTWSDRRHQ
jgi:hypothetical protein